MVWLLAFFGPIVQDIACAPDLLVKRHDGIIARLERRQLQDRVIRRAAESAKLIFDPVQMIFADLVAALGAGRPRISI
jgi:hypothetical protein